MGVTFAILRLFGKIPEVNNWLIMVVIHLDTSAVINFKNSEEIPSCPLLVELFVFFNNAQGSSIIYKMKSKITIVSTSQIISKMRPLVCTNV